MSLGNCVSSGGDRRISRLFFYFAAILLILALTVLISGCSDDTDSENNSATQIVFVLNNGEDDVVCKVGDSIPNPDKQGHYFEGWYTDESFTYKENAESFADLISKGVYKLYAKWEKLKDMKGLHIKSATFLYDGRSHIPEIDGLPDKAEIGVYPECIDAGEYDVTVTIKAYGFNDYICNTKLNIEKAKIDISKIRLEDKEFIWDGTEKSVELAGELPTGITVHYENNVHSEVGEYEVTASFDVGKNYESIDPLTAKLIIKPKTYKITLTEEDGSSRVIEINHGEVLANFPKPKEKIGYSGKWSREDFQNIREDTVVYAVYEKAVYKIEYDGMGGSLPDGAVTEYTIDNSLTLPAPERDYYIFEGWYDNPEYNGESITEIGIGSYGDKKYYAKWTVREYTVRFELFGGVNNNNNINSSGGTYVYSVESKNLILAPAEKYSFEFVCWKDESGEVITEIISEHPKDMTVYAEWAERRYTITYELNGGENNAGNPDSYTEADEEIELLPPTKDGYQFAGWYDNVRFLGEEVTFINCYDCQNITLYAKWVQT